MPDPGTAIVSQPYPQRGRAKPGSAGIVCNVPKIRFSISIPGLNFRQIPCHRFDPGLAVKRRLYQKKLPGFRHCRQVPAAGKTCSCRCRLSNTLLNPDRLWESFLFDRHRLTVPLCPVFPGSIASDIERGIHIGVGHIPAVGAFKMFPGASAETTAPARSEVQAGLTYMTGIPRLPALFSTCCWSGKKDPLSNENSKDPSAP